MLLVLMVVAYWLGSVAGTSWFIMIATGNLHHLNAYVPALSYSEVFSAILWPSLVILVVSVVWQIITASD